MGLSVNGKRMGRPPLDPSQRKPKKKRGPMSRPLKNFDQKIFENLCRVWCTHQELEHILDCDKVTLDKWCKRTYNASLSETYKRFSDDGACSLRRFQYQLAAKNAAMAIWLGKQRLGQKEDPNSAHAFDGALKAYIDLHRSMIASDYKKTCMASNHTKLFVEVRP